MSNAKILIVDDDPYIVSVLESTLKDAGYQYQHTDSADKALAWLREKNFDLLLLDVELPGFSGLKLLETLKQDERTATLPVIMLTVLSDEKHKVRGLEGGADDYLTKPFSSPELLARISALLRRTRHSGQMNRVLGDDSLRVDLDSREVTTRGTKISLTPSEFDLLTLFLQSRGTVLSNQRLAAELSKGARDVTSETLYYHIKNLRAKLGPEGRKIETVYGIGYKLVG